MKRILTIVLALAMILVMAGCGNTPAPSASTAPSATKAPEASASAAPTATVEPEPVSSEPVTISFFWREGGDIYVEPDSYICQKILQDLNIVYEHVTPSGGMTQEEMLQIRLSSNQVPDIMESYNAQTVNLRKLGAIIPIQDYMNDQYIPYVIRNQYNWDAALALCTRVNGEVWEMPVTMANDVEQVPYIRYDWLKNLNLEVPTTMEELAVVLEAFTKNDPDGNGKADTVGAMISGIDNGINTNFGAGSRNWYSDGNGGVILGMRRQNIKDYWKYVKGLYDTGAMDAQIVDPDVRTGVKLGEWVKAGKIGFSFFWNDVNDNNDIRKLQPDADWRPMNPPKGVFPEGLRPVGGVMRQTYVVSAFCGDRLEAVWRLLDYMAHDDSDLPDNINYDSPYWEVSYGQRGVNWDVLDGRFSQGVEAGWEGASDETNAKLKELWQNNEAAPFNRNCRRFRILATLIANQSGWTTEQRDAWDFARAMTTTKQYTLDHPFGTDPNVAVDTEGLDMPEEVAAFFSEWFDADKFGTYTVNWVMGKKDIDADFDAMIQQAEAEGLKDIEKIMTDFLKEQGKI